MSYSILQSNISSQQWGFIDNMLHLQPDIFNNKYSRPDENKPIIFYRNEQDKIYLPYLFASSLFQIIPNIDHQFMSTNLIFTGSLRPTQIEVELEAWTQLQHFGTTTLGLYPGFGKTILGAKLASRTQLLTVILVHREILTTQWKKTFDDFTNAKDHIWIVGEKNPPLTCTIIICMDTRCDQIPIEIRDKIGLLIIDEAHAFCTPNHVKCLLTFQPKYIVIESAT